MSEQEPKRKQLLFVDDDREFLAQATSLLKQMSDGRWAIRTATNHSQAMEQLKAQQVDIVVLDVQMPVMDGVEFLRLLSRTHAQQQVVMLTDHTDESARQRSLELGAILFLQKPRSPEEFQALFSALDALAMAGPQSGFRGVMQRVGLEDVLQMECLARKSSILGVSTGSRRGRIFICDGEIIHAESGPLQGEMALYSLLALKGGEFKLEPFTEPSRRSIAGDYQFLLMEAARLRDEGGPEATASAATRSRAYETGAEAAVPIEARGIRIAEMLLCSGPGEVLYQSECENINSRLELFKKIEQVAMQASKGTPSGRFHKVSVETQESRTVVQIQSAFKLLVRSESPKETPVHG